MSLLLLFFLYAPRYSLSFELYLVTWSSDLEHDLFLAFLLFDRFYAALNEAKEPSLPVRIF